MGASSRILKGATFFVFFIRLFSTEPARAQSYYFLKFTGATIVPGTTDRNNRCDDCVTAVLLPFAVNLYGTAFTTANVSSNGNLQFGTSNVDYMDAPLPASGFTYAIFANWDDFATSGFPVGAYGVFTSATGFAPNRIFNIEWRTSQAGGSLPNPPTDNFEVRLYEGQQRFDIIYGKVGTSGTSSTVGVQKDGTDFTQFESGTAGTLFNGLRLTAITTTALQASLHVTAVSHIPGSNAVTVSFTALGGATYRLERKLSLSDPMWQPIAGVSDLSPTSDGSAQVTDPNGLSQAAAYYRVRALP